MKQEHKSYGLHIRLLFNIINLGKISVIKFKNKTKYY